MTYPRFPTARPNLFALLPPAQHIIAAAARAGVNTRLMPEINAWCRAGRPATWTNGNA